MIYKEIPSPVIRKENIKYGIAYSGVKDLKGCCLTEIHQIGRNTIGLQFHCGGCQNMISTKETATNIFKSGEATPEATVYAIHYLKPYWFNAAVEKDISNRDISKSSILVDSSNHISLVQYPAEWFENGTIQMLKTDNKVLIAGILKKEYVNSKLSNIVSKSLSNNPIERY